MISRWPIRNKLFVGIGLLMATIVALAATSLMGVYAFRSLAKSLRMRAPELSLSADLVRDLSRLKGTFDLYEESIENDAGFRYASVGTDMLQGRFTFELKALDESFSKYRALLEENKSQEAYRGIAVSSAEAKDVREFQQSLTSIKIQSENLEPYVRDDVAQELATLDEVSQRLPKHLHTRLGALADNVRGQYRMWIFLNALMAGFSSVLLGLSLWLFYRWILAPLRILIHGSRRVASGDFGHRIHLTSKDEMEELAGAMNNMTRRFQEIRDDLDRQVRERTKEVVRSEQLASVGFLAAGVAHEINNPLASIALCAESLEERLHDVMSVELEGTQAEDAESEDAETEQTPHPEMEVVREYLRMMQDEAFRCKGITERLLDFSRLGDVEKQNTDLTDLVRSVIEMVKHLGKYKEKSIEFDPGEVVYAPVNSQEIKQVVLNLLTNALDSLNPGGCVRISLVSVGKRAKLVVTDDGCGMTEEVRRHLFEPFFTRRRDGQGTGLGMSITYRIVTDHGGDIDAQSAGPGAGSTVTVSLPLMNHEQEKIEDRYAA